MNNKDRLILQKIVEYCDQISETCSVFGNSLEGFSNSHIFQNACCMCILQIGELTGKLSDILESTWETIRSDSPDLREKCQRLLESN